MAPALTPTLRDLGWGRCCGKGLPPLPHLFSHLCPPGMGEADLTGKTRVGDARGVGSHCSGDRCHTAWWAGVQAPLILREDPPVTLWAISPPSKVGNQFRFLIKHHVGLKTRVQLEFGLK